MSAKIFSVRGAIYFIALGLFVSGCTPAGPRALLKGKKHLDQGDNAAAVAQLKTATVLMATNALAWDYYGVALQRSGQPDEAATAYQMALRFNRDLVEAHLNLGALWLEQGKPEAAKAEFMAFTQLRPNDTAGWLKLGSAQLKLGEIVPAERSFSTVLALKASEAEAYNGLGLARIQRGKPRDAAQFFAAAIQARADYAPAILNLATVTQQYLRDNRAALENYRAWLALAPRTSAWDEVNAVAAGLEKSQIPAPVPPSPVVARGSPPAPEPKTMPKPPNAGMVHPAISNLPEPVVKMSPHGTPRSPVISNPAPVQVVSVPPAPPIVAKPSPVVVPAEPALEVPVPEPPRKTGFWHRLFGTDQSGSAPKPEYLGKGLTSLPSLDEPAVHAPGRPATAESAAAIFARYRYSFPGKPAAGDRRAAAGAFTKAQLFEQGEKWVDAEQWYQTAAELDPAWFEAQFNTGVLAHRLRNFPLALPRYELALAIRPDSADARYNFALALQAAGFAPDAADELKKLLAAEPGDVRVHLALGNLYAQSLRDTAPARQHYLKVLELDPNNPRASDIRFWLSANPR